MSANCIFCQIVAGDLSAVKVAESDHALAFRDLNPQAPVHVLVIPKAHVDSLAEADNPEMLGAVLQLVAEVARLEGVAETGYRTVFNTNKDGGQTVGHLHAHLLGGRHMAWPPG